MPKHSLKAALEGGEQNDAPKQDFRAQFANSKKSASSLSFAFHASSFSMSSKDSRNEQKVQRSLRSVIQRPAGTGTMSRRASDTMVAMQQRPAAGGDAKPRRASDTMAMQQQQSGAGKPRRASDTMAMKSRPGLGQRRASAPSVHINPPTFALARGQKEGSVRQTMGVPMISAAEDNVSNKKKNKVAAVAYKVNKTQVAMPKRGGMFHASPPAMSVTKGGTSRARRTLGVPMV